MSQQEPQTVVLKRGTWKYQDLVTAYVWIICQNWDYYYEEGFDADPPDLDVRGEAYYVLYGTNPALDQSTSRSATLKSFEEALAAAEAAVGPVNWLADP